MTSKLTLSRIVSLAALAAAAAYVAPALAQDDIDCAASPDDPACVIDDGSDTIVVTGMQVRQGGAQDIRHFRSISASGEFMPPSGSLTLEGLMGEHDLALPGGAKCEQLFCLVAHSTKANLPLRPQDKYFVGLGFDSNIDAESVLAEPLSLIAVVDRSGSMNGEPIMRVKEGLREVLKQMGPGDRMGIV